MGFHLELSPAQFYGEKVSSKREMNNWQGARESEPRNRTER